jgi:L-malate glycosyltransferase
VKILQISSARAIGGGERHLIDLCEGLEAKGHEVHLAIPEESPVRERVTGLPAESIHAVTMRNALDLVSARKLARLVREFQIDIVHAHLGRDYPLAALAVGRGSRSKLVITRHVLFPLSAAHRLTFRRVSRLIAVSRAVASAIESQRLIPNDRIRVVHNGLDYVRISADVRNTDREALLTELELPRNRRLVASVGELNPLKGHEEFIRAAAKVAEEFSDVDFVIVGAERSEKSQYKQKLQELARDLGLQDRVHFRGWISSLSAFLGVVDLFVSASRTESFGLAILEAMMCETAVVATRTEGASEIVTDQKTGLLVDIGDSQALARAQLQLLRNKNERKRLAATGMDAARQRFSIEKMVTETEQVYTEALGL